MKIEKLTEKIRFPVICQIVVFILFLNFAYSQAPDSNIAQSNKVVNSAQNNAPGAFVTLATNYNLLDTSYIGKEVAVLGTVVDYVESKDDSVPNIITITNGNRNLQISFRNVLKDKVPPEAKIVGTRMWVKATGKDYHGAVQLNYTETSQVKIETVGNPSLISPDILKNIQSLGTFSIKQINDDKKRFLGQNVVIEGEVTGFKASWMTRAPNKVSLSDGTGVINVVYWSDVAQYLEASPAVGNRFRFTGTVQDFKNELQLKIKKRENLILLNGNSAPAAETSQNQDLFQQNTSGSSSFPNNVPPAANQSKPVTVSGSIKWITNVEEGIKVSAQTGKKICVFFHSDRVKSSSDFEASSYSNPEISGILSRFVLVKIDAAQNKDLCSNFNVFKVPTIILTDSNGSIFWRKSGYTNPADIQPLNTF